MVTATLREIDPKGQTRRVVKLYGKDGLETDHSVWRFCVFHGDKAVFQHITDIRRVITQKCPYGKPGDRLWVREAWKAAVGLDVLSGKQIGEKALSAGYKKPWAPMTYLADGRVVHGEVMRPGTGEFGTEFGRYRHPRFMPRWASRILLEITDVRVQRLQEISKEDAIAEGIHVLPLQSGEDSSAWFESAPGLNQARSAEGSFALLWKQINGEGSFSSNPWVWAITFKRIQELL
jgi:hypothetical protein